MNLLSPVIIVAIIAIGIYRLFELFVRRKERIMIIEKMHFEFDPQMLNKKMFLPLFQFRILQNNNWALRIGMLFVGVGLGIIVGFFIRIPMLMTYTQTLSDLNHGSALIIAQEATDWVYLAVVILFGGLGLVGAYIIERRNMKKDEVK